MKDLPRNFLDDDGSDDFCPKPENTTTSGLRTGVPAIIQARRRKDEFFACNKNMKSSKHTFKWLLLSARMDFVLIFYLRITPKASPFLFRIRIIVRARPVGFKLHELRRSISLCSVRGHAFSLIFLCFGFEGFKQLLPVSF